MELDQLKQRWQQADNNTTPNFRNIFNRRNLGPIGTLKRNFRRQIIILLFVLFLIIRQLHDRVLYENVFFMWYACCALLLCAFFYINLQLVRALENTDNTMIAYIKNEVALLEKRMKWQRWFVRFAIVALIVLLEVLPYFSDERMLQKWHNVSLVIRIAAYAALLLFQYFVKNMVAHRRYGRHIERLKEILAEAE